MTSVLNSQKANRITQILKKAMRTNDFVADRNAPTTNHSQWLEVVQKHVESLRFGFVQITVHESNVVQIDTTERVRFQPTKEAVDLIRLNSVRTTIK